MFSRLKSQSRLASYWPGFLGILVILVPVVIYGPWIPFVDIVAFVGIDSYPPKLSYGPAHYYTFQYTYVLAHAISRLLVDLGVSAPFQTSFFYLAQALVFFGVIWGLLELLVPQSFPRKIFIILGALAFWDGVFVWGGPLAYSLGAALLAVATYLSVREAAQPERSADWPTALLALLAVASHPFSLPFALILFTVRVLFLPRSRLQSIGVIALLLVYRMIIVKENPEPDPGDLISQLFHWYPQHLPTRIAEMFTADIRNVETLFQLRPTFLLVYFGLLGAIHLLGFTCSSIVALIAKDKPALRMLATLNAILFALYMLAKENAVITLWPQRILAFHSSITYAAGIATIFYLAQRYSVVQNIRARLPISGAASKPIILSLLVAGLFAVEMPILRLGRTISRNYSHLRDTLLRSEVRGAVLITSDIQIAPFYLRCIPFLLFSDKEVINRRLLVVTEWHLQGRHPSRIAAVSDQSIPHYRADYDMENGLVSVHLTPMVAAPK